MLCSYGADLSAYNDIGETALLTAIAFNNMEILSILWQETRHYIPSEKGESVIHYAARYNNIALAKFACDPRKRIDVNLVSFHEKLCLFFLVIRLIQKPQALHLSPRALCIITNRMQMLPYLVLC